LGCNQEISSPWGLCIVKAPKTQPKPQVFPSRPAYGDQPRIPVSLGNARPPPMAVQLPGASNSKVPSAPPMLTQNSTVPIPPAPPLFIAPLPPPAPLPPSVPVAPSLFTSPLQGSTMDTPFVLLIAMSGSHQIWAYFFEDTVWWSGR